MNAYTLTRSEQATAAAAAAERNARADRLHIPNKIESLGRSLEHELQSIAAEIAAAVALGIQWTDKSIEDDRLGDLLPGLQVRHTTYDTGRLILRESDNLRHDFVLVTGTYPTFTVRGWINAAAGLSIGEVGEQFRQGPRYVTVTQRDLLPITTHKLHQTLHLQPVASLSLFQPAPLMLQRLAA